MLGFQRNGGNCFSALLLVGCGKDDDDGGGNLVLGDGEAWINKIYSCFTDNSGTVCNWEEVGWIFQQNNDWLQIGNNDGQWYVTFIAKWSTSGNNLTIADIADGDEYSMTVPYNVSGNTLTLDFGGGRRIVYKKRNGIYPVYPNTDYEGF